MTTPDDALLREAELEAARLRDLLGYASPADATSTGATSASATSTSAGASVLGAAHSGAGESDADDLGTAGSHAAADVALLARLLNTIDREDDHGADQPAVAPSGELARESDEAPCRITTGDGPRSAEPGPASSRHRAWRPYLLAAAAAVLVVGVAVLPWILDGESPDIGPADTPTETASPDEDGTQETDSATSTGEHARALDAVPGFGRSTESQRRDDSLAYYEAYLRDVAVQTCMAQAGFEWSIEGYDDLDVLTELAESLGIAPATDVEASTSRGGERNQETIARLTGTDRDDYLLALYGVDGEEYDRAVADQAEFGGPDACILIRENDDQSVWQLRQALSDELLDLQREHGSNDGEGWNDAVAAELLARHGDELAEHRELYAALLTDMADDDAFHDHIARELAILEAGGLEDVPPDPTPTASPDVFAPACEPVPITRLPDGSEPGAPVMAPNDEGWELVEWGSGDNRVSQVSGADALAATGGEEAMFDPAHYPDSQVAQGLTGERLIMPVGDWGLGMVQIRSTEGDCHYVTWLPAGTTEQQARDFAATF